MADVEQRRSYYDSAKKRYTAWRSWQRNWRWANSILGGISIAVGATIAAYTSSGSEDAIRQLIDAKTAAKLSIVAPVLTWLLTALKPQAQAAAFEIASRELEKAIISFETDPEKSDKDLGAAICNAIDVLNKVGAPS